MLSVNQKIDNFFGAYPQKHRPKGAVLIQAEQRPSSIFYLTSGRVDQCDITPVGNVIVVNVYKPRAFFPMSSALENLPNHYFFEAATDITYREAPLEDVADFVRNEPDVTLDLLTRVYRGVDGILQRVALLMGSNTVARVQFELVNACYRFGVQQKDGSFIVPLTETDIAKHSGLARETVSRCVRRLKEQNLIAINKKGIAVHDLAKLESLRES